MVAVFMLHGAAFTAMRMPRERRAAAVRAARRTAPVAACLLTAGGLAVPVLGIDLVRPVPAALSLVVAVVAAIAGPRLLERGRDGQAFALTEGAAGPDALALLTRFALPVVPVLLAAQVWLWWVFRHRVSRGSAVFF